MMITDNRAIRWRLFASKELDRFREAIRRLNDEQFSDDEVGDRLRRQQNLLITSLLALRDIEHAAYRAYHPVSNPRHFLSDLQGPDSRARNDSTYSFPWMDAIQSRCGWLIDELDRDCSQENYAWYGGMARDVLFFALCYVDGKGIRHFGKSWTLSRKRIRDDYR